MRPYFRGDAAFANPEIYEFLEGEGMGYAIRLPANRVLQERIGYLLKRPVGRPAHEVRRCFASFGYQAQSWKKPRRVVAKVEWGGVVVPDEFAGEADKNRCQGGQTWPLRDVPDGRGRGVAADVQGYPDAHRPAAGSARSSVTGRRGQMREPTKAEVRLEHGKPASSSVASRAPGHFGCQRAGCDRISLPQRLGEMQDHTQGIRNPENVGLLRRFFRRSSTSSRLPLRCARL